jgi:ATP adenylyltransferase
MTKQYLYSPWRMEYILGEKATDCVMCRANSLGDDEANLILDRGKLCYVMLNRYPYNKRASDDRTLRPQKYFK